jgi:PIN domain nuclease of toxin-antitoxin system
MKVLLDTHILAWYLSGDIRTPRAAKTMLADPETDACYSMASLWEVAIKVGLDRRQRDPMPAAAAELRDYADEAQLRLLDITLSHVSAAGSLPWHHRDPFDRMLVAQAQVDGLILLTADQLLQAYGEFVVMV